MKQYKFLCDSHSGSMDVFDVDNTLVITSGMIDVTDHKNGINFRLSPEEFDNYQFFSYHTLDFSEFDDIQILKSGTIIERSFSMIKSSIEMRKAVGIVTARNNEEVVREFLLDHQIDINPDFIFGVNNPKYGWIGSNAHKKKMAFNSLITMGFSKFNFFDDRKANLDSVKSIESELPAIEINCELIDNSWIQNKKE